MRRRSGPKSPSTGCLYSLTLSAVMIMYIVTIPFGPHNTSVSNRRVCVHPDTCASFSDRIKRKRKYNVAKATNRKLGRRQVPPRREVHCQLRTSELGLPVGVGLSPRRPTFLYWSLPIRIHFLDQSVTLDCATPTVRRQTTHSLTYSLTLGSCRDAWS